MPQTFLRHNSSNFKLLSQPLTCFPGDFPNARSIFHFLSLLSRTFPSSSTRIFLLYVTRTSSVPDQDFFAHIHSSHQAMSSHMPFLTLFTFCLWSSPNHFGTSHFHLVSTCSMLYPYLMHRYLPAGAHLSMLCIVASLLFVHEHPLFFRICLEFFTVTPTFHQTRKAGCTLHTHDFSLLLNNGCCNQG